MSDKSLVQMLTANLRRKGEFVLGSSENLLSEVKYYTSTGCWPLDAAMGKGIPGGRLIELYGDESTGKSLVGLNLLANVQAQGGIGLLLDPEMTTSMEMAKLVGVNIEELLIAYPSTIEEVYKAVHNFIEAKKEMDKEQGKVIPALILWDSIAATSSEVELEGVEAQGIGKADMAIHARSLSKMLRVVTREFSVSGVTGVFINQTRDKIGVMYGDKQSTFGGKALKFYASVRIKLAVSIAAIKEKKDDALSVTGVEVTALIVKNKVGRPFGKAKFPILFDTGIDNCTACLWFLKECGVVKTSGAWSTITLGGEEKKFQGAGWAELFTAHYDEIYQLVSNREALRADEKEITAEDIAE